MDRSKLAPIALIAVGLFLTSGNGCQLPNFGQVINLPIKNPRIDKASVVFVGGATFGDSAMLLSDDSIRTDIQALGFTYHTYLAGNPGREPYARLAEEAGIPAFLVIGIEPGKEKGTLLGGKAFVIPDTKAELMAKIKELTGRE